MNTARSSGLFFISVVTVLDLDAVHHVLEELEALALVLDQRVALAEGAQVDALLQVVHVEQVVLPARVDDLQHHGALDAAHLLRADEALALVVLGERVVDGRGRRPRPASPRPTSMSLFLTSGS